MFRRIQRSTLLAAVLLTAMALAVASSPARAADQTIVTRLSTATGEPVTATHYFSDAKLRTAEDRFEVIVDLESGLMTLINHRQRQYFDTNAAQLRDHYADVEALAKTNPILSRLLAGATSVEVEETGRERQVADVACQERALELGSDFKIKVCNGPALEIPDAFYDARRLLWAHVGPMSIFFAKSFEAMKDFDGFPLMFNTTSAVPGFEMMTRVRVTEIEPQIPADAFAIPAQYEKIKSPYE